MIVFFSIHLSVLYKFESLATALSGIFRLAAVRVLFKYSDGTANCATGWSEKVEQ